MKIKIILSVMVLFSVFAFIISKPTEKGNKPESEKQNLLPPPSSVDSFIVGAFQSGCDTRRDRLTDTLGFNLWFRYLGGTIDGPNGLKIQKGWTDYDKTFDTVIHSSVWDILDSNSDYNMKTIMHRPNIEWLAFGQRSDYQCEDNILNPDFYFYRYNLHPQGSDMIDNSIYGGSNVKVRYCQQGTHDSGYVVRDLLSNREQINVRASFGGVPYPGLGDKQFDWYIKPRIRIDSVDAYLNKKVCKIEIMNFNGDIIKTQYLYGRNFRDTTNEYYNGRYLEEYYTKPSYQVDLKILGNKSDSSRNAFNPYDSNRFSTNCKVDFRVFWYGECDMWLDYVRVEDDRAYNLFNPTAPKHDLYMSMINAESNLASQNPSTALMFYTEEFEFNHIPCIKYVYDRLYQQSGIRGSFYGGPGYGWYGDHVNNLFLYDLGINHFKHIFHNMFEI